MKFKFLLPLFFLLIVVTFSSYALELGEIDGKGVIIQQPPVTINYSTIYVNSSDFWDSLDTPADILHNLLDNLNWNDAGHTMDTDLDMNSNSILEVGDLDVENDIGLGDRIFHDTDVTTYLETDDGWINFFISGIQSIYLTPVYARFFTNVTMNQNLNVDGDINVSGSINVTGNITTRGSWCNATNCYELSELLSGSIYYSDEIWINKNASDGFVFNDSKFDPVYHNATQAGIVNGVIDGGDLGDTQHQDAGYDGVSFNFSEEVTGLDLRMNFTGLDVDTFSRGIMRYKTSDLK